MTPTNDSKIINQSPAPPWKVTYDGGFWDRHGRAGKEIPIGITFRWGEETWHVPAVYACAKGLVVDLLMEAEPETVKAFIEKWDLWHEEEKRFTKEEMRQIEREHPLNVNLEPHLTLNGKPLQGDHGCGTRWIPASCLPEGFETETEAKAVLEHYGLDLSKAWTIRRWAFHWATKNKPDIRSLRLRMERDAEELVCARFVTPAVGESVTVVHPLTGTVHTLTVREYEAQALEQRHFPDPGMEYPTHFVAMSYTLTPDVDHMHFTLQDCSEGDAPRRRQAGTDDFRPTAACSVAVIGIIGGASGPTALVAGGNVPEKLHAACSSLHFEPVSEPVEWEAAFREKLMEDVEVALIPAQKTATESEEAMEDFKALENALAAGIAALKPAPAELVEKAIESMQDMITFDRGEKDNAKWKALLEERLHTAKTFEIHCWSDETEWIELALRYGTEKDADWQHGTVIEGPVTEGFAAMLLGQAKPADTEIYNKMTPFFNVFLDNGFSSSHYGTEVFVKQSE